MPLGDPVVKVLTKHFRKEVHERGIKMIYEVVGHLKAESHS